MVSCPEFILLPYLRCDIMRLGDVFDRGSSIEYDEWETLGNAGWNSQSIFAAAFKGEKFTPPNATWDIEYDIHDHGLHGPLDASFNAPSPA
jgi:hypothetical protein